MKYVLAIGILLFGILVGYLLRYFTKEELEVGRRYFRWLWVAAGILALVSLILPVSIVLKQTMVFSFIFIAIVAFISWKK